MRTSVWWDPVNQYGRNTRHTSSIRVVCISHHLRRRTRVQVLPLDLNALRQVRVLYNNTPQPTIAAGVILGESGDAQSSLDDEDILRRIDGDPARGGKIRCDNRRVQATSNRYRRLEAQRIMRRALCNNQGEENRYDERRITDTHTCSLQARPRTLAAVHAPYMTKPTADTVARTFQSVYLRSHCRAAYFDGGQ